MRRWAPGASLLFLAVAFLPTVFSFVNTWSRYNYAYGWLVPPLLAWLLWSDRDRFAGRRGGNALLLVPLAGLSIFWLLATVTEIQQFHQAAFVVLLGFWGAFVFGRPAARTVIAATVVALLSLPIWEASILPLRRIATIASGLMVKALGVTAELDGTMIHLTVGSFEVGPDCAGLNYLLAALVIGITYAQVLVRRNSLRLITVALAAALAIVGNWVRVAIIVLVGQVTAMEGWLIDHHVSFGWVVFGVALIFFFTIMNRLGERLDDQPADRDQQESTAPAEEVDRHDESSAHRGEPRAAAALATRAALATAFAVVGPLVFYTVSVLPTAPVPEPGLEALARGAGWQPAPAEAGREVDWHPSYVGADQHDRLIFTDGERQVYGERFLYIDQEQYGKLIGWPNRIARSEDVLADDVVGPVDPDRSLWVRQAIVRTEDRPILVWYWYRVAGTPTFNRVRAKALEVPAFFFRRESAELLSLSTPCEPTSCEQAIRTLTAFSGLRSPDGQG